MYEWMQMQFIGHLEPMEALNSVNARESTSVLFAENNNYRDRKKVMED